MKTTANGFSDGCPTLTVSGRRLSIAFPDTVLEEHESLRDKTLKIGQIARMSSVFGVDVVQIFRDPRGKGESALIRHVLEYLETPQYLRRRLFPLDESLKFAGLLPPLRIPSHRPKVPVARVPAGEVREGVTLSDGSSVDVGLDVPVSLRQKVGSNKRVTVKVVSTSPLSGVVVDRSEAPEYWGYTVEVRSSDEVLNDGRFGLKVATSRLGDPLAECLPALTEQFARSTGVLAVFGSPSRGLFDLVKDLRHKTRFVVNLYPEQHAVTVRTEEAMASALYLFEVLSALKNTKA
jgi:predicted SPOUT superfamily RNA methylase MTH1